MALGPHAKLKGISCRKDNPSEITRSQSSRNNTSPRCTSGVMSDAVAMAWMRIQISLALSVMSLFASPRYVPSLASNFVMCMRRGTWDSSQALLASPQGLCSISWVAARACNLLATSSPESWQKPRARLMLRSLHSEVSSSTCAKFSVAPPVPMVGGDGGAYTLLPTSWDPETLGTGIVGGSDHPNSV